MRMAIAQMGTRAGDFAHTAERMAAYSRTAAERGVELLAFPAMALTGASSVPAPDAEGFALDLADALAGLLDTLACPCLVPVAIDVEGTRLPEALLIEKGQVRPVRLGTLLAELRARRAGAADGAPEGPGAPGAPAGHAAPEGAGAPPASIPLPELEVSGVRMGVAFSYDDLDEYVSYDYDVDVVVFLSSYGLTVDDPESAMGAALDEARFADDAEDMGAWLVGVGSVGCYDGEVFVGSSFALSPWGDILAQAPTLEEDLLVFDIDPHDEGPLAAPLLPEVFDPTMLTWEALAFGIRELVGSLGATDACVVVDGSLTSSLAATLAVDALGPTHVHALVPDTRQARVTRATNALVRGLRLPDDHVRHVDVSRVDDLALRDDLAEAHLAALARDAGAVALGHASKTTLALRPGCRAGAAQLEPLGDLYLSDVVALARLRNTVSPVIPRGSLTELRVDDVLALAPASPSTERRLDFVDCVLCSYIEGGRPVSDVVVALGHPEEVEAVLARLRETDPVRPDVLTVVLSTRTLAESRRPQGLAWHDRVRADDERLDEEALAQALADGLGASMGGAPGERGAGAAGGPDPDPDADEEGPADAEGRMGDILGYLRDFSAGGGFELIVSDDDETGDGDAGGGSRPRGASGGQGAGPAGSAGGQGTGRRPQGGPPRPSGWSSPFSEN